MIELETKRLGGGPYCSVFKILNRVKLEDSLEKTGVCWKKGLKDHKNNKERNSPRNMSQLVGISSYGCSGMLMWLYKVCHKNVKGKSYKKVACKNSVIYKNLQIFYQDMGKVLWYGNIYKEYKGYRKTEVELINEMSLFFIETEIYVKNRVLK